VWMLWPPLRFSILSSCILCSLGRHASHYVFVPFLFLYSGLAIPFVLPPLRSLLISAMKHSLRDASPMDAMAGSEEQGRAAVGLGSGTPGGFGGAGLTQFMRLGAAGSARGPSEHPLPRRRQPQKGRDGRWPGGAWPSLAVHAGTRVGSCAARFVPLPVGIALLSSVPSTPRRCRTRGRRGACAPRRPARGWAVLWVRDWPVDRTPTKSST